MKKAVLAVLCVAICGSALAGWEVLSCSADGKTTFYADASTIHKAGTSLRMWTLIDYQEAQPISADRHYLSVKMLEEINCEELKARHLNLAAFSEHKGAGKMVGSEKKPAAWRQLPHDPGVEITINFACNRPAATQP